MSLTDGVLSRVGLALEIRPRQTFCGYRRALGLKPAVPPMPANKPGISFRMESAFHSATCEVKSNQYVIPVSGP